MEVEGRFSVLSDLNLVQEMLEIEEIKLRMNHYGIKEKRRILQSSIEYLRNLPPQQDHFVINCLNVYSFLTSDIENGSKDIAKELRLLLLQLSFLLDQEQINVSTRNKVSLLCEENFLQSEPESRNYLPGIFLFLVLESLKPSTKEQYIKRLLAISHGFDSLDFSTSGQLFNYSCLLRCFVHPSFLKSKEGKKVLATLALANEGFLLEEMNRIIKAQVIAGGKHVCIAYGEVFHNLWRESVERGVWKKIEQYLQDFIFEAIHTVNPRYFKGLRFMIKSFHDVKRGEMFETALSRTFEPILWRSLQCANAVVRTQACILFFDVFPLQNPSLNSEHMDIYMQKQFDQLASLLKDSDHRVRSTAVIGAFHVLKDYWEILPASTTLNLMKYLFEVLVHDVSDQSVRVAVMVGVRELLSQPLAHKSLQNLLPIIGSSLNDRCERVRLEFVRLLQKISRLKNFHYYEIIDVTSLMNRLVLDQHNPQIVRAICELLLPSFFPQGSEDQLQRCLQFSENNIEAAIIFYGHLNGLVSLGSIVKLLVILFQLLLANLEKNPPNEIPQVFRATGKRSRKEVMALPSISLSDKMLICGIMKLLSSILDNISEDVIDQIPSAELLLKYFTPTNLFLACEQFNKLFNLKPVSVALSFQTLRKFLQICDLLQETNGSAKLALEHSSKLFSTNFFILTLSKCDSSIVSEQYIFLTHFTEASKCLIILKKDISIEFNQALQNGSKTGLILFQTLIKELFVLTEERTEQQKIFYQLESSLEKIKGKILKLPADSQLVVIQVLTTIAMFRRISSNLLRDDLPPEMLKLSDLFERNVTIQMTSEQQSHSDKVLAILSSAVQTCSVFSLLSKDSWNDVGITFARAENEEDPTGIDKSQDFKDCDKLRNIASRLWSLSSTPIQAIHW